MTDALNFDLRPALAQGVVERVSPLVRRLTAPNPSPYTFTGTNTYIVGSGTVAVIDPGPAADAHLAALRHTLKGETVSHILLTHTHLDHTPLAPVLRGHTGAPVLAFAAHGAGRREGPAVAEADHGGDLGFAPDATLADGQAIAGPGWTLTAVHTPGHASNHLCFALAEEAALFSGDHVMAWSTTVVAPPDGHMGDYLASLARLAERGEGIYWPGHGGPVEQPRRFVRALLAHRQGREAAILARLADGPASARALVGPVYGALRTELETAAALTILAHLLRLAETGKAASRGPADLDTVFEPAG